MTPKFLPPKAQATKVNTHVIPKVSGPGIADRFEEGRLQKGPTIPPPPASQSELVTAAPVKRHTTLKRACSPEYRGAQGAFKDSMIH